MKYYNWNRDGLDAPLITPSNIPEGFQQRWSPERQEYVLIHQPMTYAQKVWKTKELEDWCATLER